MKINFEDFSKLQILLATNWTIFRNFQYEKIYKYRSVYPYINTYSDNLVKYRRKGTISDWDHVEPIYNTTVDLRYTNPNIYTDKLVIHKHYHPYWYFYNKSLFF